MGIENAQNTPGNMLPVGLPSGPTSDRRTDAQIAAEKKGTSDLESGTVRDANGQIRNMRQFKVDPPESYVQYVKRVEGLVDIQVLPEEAWRKATGQKTRTEEMLEELGVTPAPKEVLTEPPSVTGPLTVEEALMLNDFLGLGVTVPEGLQTLTIKDGKEVVAQYGTIPALVPLQTPVLTETVVAVKDEIDIP
jgi:hypothetical protein